MLHAFIHCALWETPIVNCSVCGTHDLCARLVLRAEVKLVAWIRQFLQKCLLRQRHIQSSGAFARGVHMGSGTKSVGRAAAPRFASTGSNAISVGRAAAPIFASMGSGAKSVGHAAALLFASTRSDAACAPSAKTCHALWKNVPSMAIASAARKACCTTCAPNTATSPKRSRRLKS